MNDDIKPASENKQPEDGTDKDLNLTNRDATLAKRTSKQPDATSMSDNATSAANDNLTQSISAGSEINPEYGDAADPTFETI